MKPPRQRSRPDQRRVAYTLVEVMISMSIISLVFAGTMSTFLFGIRMMYKDTQRLATNATLRYFVAQVSKETLDASEFYIFENYQALDGSVDISSDTTTYTTSADGIDIYHGDCLVLVTRASLADDAAVRQFRIYYRQTTTPSAEAPIRYYESGTFDEDDADGDGAKQTDALVEDLLDKINLKNAPSYPGSRVLAARSRGRPAANNASLIYPIFSSEFPTLTKTNENVSINVEVINGSSINNLLSSSSFNYTISPRR